jgi:protein TonB
MLLLCLFATLSAIAQDTTFYNAHGKEVASGEPFSTYAIKLKDRDSIHHTIRKYSYEGQLVSVRQLKDSVRDGREADWYDNDQKHSEFRYRDGELHGDMQTWWRNGQHKRKAVYENGKRVSGIQYDSLGSETTWTEYMIMPEFPGGQAGITKYLQKTMRYPIVSRDNNHQGIVLVQFIIDTTGAPTSIEIVKSVTRELDAEAARIITSMPRWTPGRIDDQLVNVYYTLPVDFRLE